MKTLMVAAVVAGALLLTTPRAGAQYAVRAGGMATSSYSYGYYPGLGYSYPNYTNGYHAGPAPGASGYSYNANYAPAGVTYPTYINSTAPGGRIGVASVGGTYVPPYSYTVVGHPYYARHYQGYGDNDFPFYGRIYGRPYDPWSWTYLSGGYSNALARYYDPPVK